MGTRFLPATKAQPKEMLSVVDKPVIQYIVEEAANAGIKEVIFVTAIGKRALEDHFDRNFELEYRLEQKNKEEELRSIRSLEKLANFAFVRQRNPLGDGHALLSAEPFIEPDEPVAVMFGDDIINAEKPAIGQLMDVYYEEERPVAALQEVPPSHTSSYGVIAGEEVTNGVWRVSSCVEKPKPVNAPSNLAIVGRYIITPEILQILKNQTAGEGGEIRLIDAFITYLEKYSIYGCKFSGRRYDCGNKLQFIMAQIELGLTHPDLREDLQGYLQEAYGCRIDQ